MTVTTIIPAPKALQKTVGGKTVTMTPEQAEAFGRELDALKERIIADLVAGTHGENRLPCRVDSGAM